MNDINFSIKLHFRCISICFFLILCNFHILKGKVMKFQINILMNAITSMTLCKKILIYIKENKVHARVNNFISKIVTQILSRGKNHARAFFPKGKSSTNLNPDFTQYFERGYFFLLRYLISLLDNAPYYLVGCVIQKRYYIYVIKLFVYIYIPLHECTKFFIFFFFADLPYFHQFITLYLVICVVQKFAEVSTKFSSTKGCQLRI